MSTSQYPFRTGNYAKLLIVSTKSNRLLLAPQSRPLLRQPFVCLREHKYASIQMRKTQGNLRTSRPHTKCAASW